MEIDEAIALLRDAVGDSGDTSGVWADLGAGAGTFTLALARMLGAGSTIYGVDDDANAVRALRELSTPADETRIIAVDADFTRPLELPGLDDAKRLDGVLLANSLHFTRDATTVLTQLVHRVRGGGRVIVVEYDRRERSRWVPYPIPASHWPLLAAASGLRDAMITATRPSEYSGYLYVGAATKP